MPTTQPLRQPLHSLLGARYATAHTLPKPAAQLASSQMTASASAHRVQFQDLTPPPAIFPTSPRSIATPNGPTTSFTTITTRELHFSARRMQYTKKDVMDRHALNPTSTENSKTGGDAAAAKESEAFDPSKTRPDTQFDSVKDKKAGSEKENPLNVSPGGSDAAQGIMDHSGKGKTRG